MSDPYPPPELSISHLDNPIPQSSLSSSMMTLDLAKAPSPIQEERKAMVEDDVDEDEKVGMPAAIDIQPIKKKKKRKSKNKAAWLS